MTRSEMAMLLGLMAARDSRKVDEIMVTTWMEDCGDLGLDDARRAVSAWYRNTRERMMPADLRAGVKAIREERDRLERKHEVLALPSRFEPDDVRAMRVKEGVAQCRDVLGPILARLKAGTEQPAGLSPADQIRERAIQRARAERKGQRA